MLHKNSTQDASHVNAQSVPPRRTSFLAKSIGFLTNSSSHVSVSPQPPEPTSNLAPIQKENNLRSSDIHLKTKDVESSEPLQEVMTHQPKKPLSDTMELGASRPEVLPQAPEVDSLVSNRRATSVVSTHMNHPASHTRSQKPGIENPAAILHNGPNVAKTSASPTQTKADDKSRKKNTKAKTNTEACLPSAPSTDQTHVPPEAPLMVSESVVEAPLPDTNHAHVPPATHETVSSVVQASLPPVFSEGSNLVPPTEVDSPPIHDEPLNVKDQVDVDLHNPERSSDAQQADTQIVPGVPIKGTHNTKNVAVSPLQDKIASDMSVEDAEITKPVPSELAAVVPSKSPVEVLGSQHMPPSDALLATASTSMANQSQTTASKEGSKVSTIAQPKSWSRKIISMTRGGVEKVTSTIVRKGTVTRVQTVDLSEDDVIIAVMGPTGTGKSSFINMVTGTNEGVGHELESCTNDINILKFQCLERSLQDIVFVDTPGFDDTHKSDIEILNLIADWLKKTYEQKVQLSGILYFHRISDNRMAGTPLKNLHMFEKLCGKDALGNIVLTTTMWDEVDEETGLQRQKELEKNYWKAMINQGSRTVRYQNDEESAWEIVDYIVGPKNHSFAVELQRELVDLGEKLPETGAGRELYGKLQSLVSRQQETLQRLKASMRRQDEQIILDALREEYEDLRNQLEATVRDMEKLKIPIGTRLRRFFTIKLGFFNRKKSDAH